jgi:K+-sensing histidine kinase KdpD
MGYLDGRLMTGESEMAKQSRGKEKYKIFIMSILIAISCFLTFYFHVIFETGVVFSHFFYIPIILAALWWKRKGLGVAVFLVALLIFSHFFIRPNVETVNWNGS